MRISTEGLKYILEKGFSKPTETNGVFFLYKWEGLEYYCGPAGFSAPQSPGKKNLYIELTPEQALLLQPEPSIKIQKSKHLQPLLNLFQSVALLKVNTTDNSLESIESSGAHAHLAHYKCFLNIASPFQIAFKTKSAFHGRYSPIKAFDENLKNHQIQKENLWITAMPKIKNDRVTHLLVGLSNDNTYGADVFDRFQEVLEKAAA